ncbi:hypothetical protein Y1Q_0013464 [Alligator mississippiensis]|uniref:Uncharacterized protein n=1 Tax=Alligator mississippiensis TaxID=8496 RepID=A0A151MSD1_ALLMI|nr:hypothetical protein Y1Q_0013464 [Alligator mississippiensis]
MYGSNIFDVSNKKKKSCSVRAVSAPNLMGAVLCRALYKYKDKARFLRQRVEEGTEVQTALPQVKQQVHFRPDQKPFEVNENNFIVFSELWIRFLFSIS